MGIQDKRKARGMAADLSTDLRIYAVQKWPTMNHKWRKAKLASMLGMNARRMKSLYEAENTARLRADEETKIIALLGQKQQVNNEASDRALAQRVAELEAQLADVVAALARDQMARGGQPDGRSNSRQPSEDRRITHRRSTD